MNLRKYLLTGVVAWLPLAITISVLVWLAGVLDGFFSLFIGMLMAVFPEQDLPILLRIKNTPGLGIILVLLVLIITGFFVTNVVGRWFAKWGDVLLTHIPIVKPIYRSVKKVSDTLFSSQGNAFRKALLVQYPRKNCWTVAFQTGIPAGEVEHRLGADYVSVYVPTTPNPTSGFFLILHRSEVIELSLSVDEALTYIISMGSVNPGTKDALENNSVNLKP